MPSSDEKWAELIVDVDTARIPQPLTYRVPAPVDDLEIGSCWLVPLGGRETLGYVVRILDSPPPDVKNIRDVLARVQMEALFDEGLADLARWVAGYYLCNLRDAARPLTPSFIISGVRSVVCLAPALRDILAMSRLLNAGRPVQLFFDQTAELPAGKALDALTVRVSPKQKEILEILAQHPEGLTVEELRSQVTLANLNDALKRLRERELAVVTKSVTPPHTTARKRKAYRLVRLPSEEEVVSLRITPKQAAVLEEFARQRKRDLGQSKPLLVTELAWRLNVGTGPLESLAQKGLLEATLIEVRRDPWPSSGRSSAPLSLTPEQQKSLNAISASVTASDHARFLLHGVTASGKTEVYLQAIQATLDAGRQAIVLVPEISLTSQVMDIFQSRFGGRVAVLHSALSDGERFDELRRIRRGEATVVVGARSGIFAPTPEPGLIILDEEHEGTYKQDQTPRYHARSVAAKRAQISGATLVLGSATPSVESYWLAKQGKMQLLTMPSRIDDRPLPPVEIVDQREEFSRGRGLFSAQLEDAVRHCLGRREQVILFLNRRGYSSSLMCRECGYTARCPNCSVSLTYHAPAGRRVPFLQCHHCDHHTNAPSECPKCRGTKIRYTGIGTEKIEIETQALFPDARLLRLDRDTTSRKDSHRRILTRFREEDADILIGTQMVAKGLDFPRVTLVGVVAADTGLNMPDFRAAERSFQLLTQVSGRAGRADLPGKVIVQTYNPDHYSLIAAQTHDFVGFYDEEIQFRQALRYPPFSYLANIIATANSQEEATGATVAAAEVFKEICPGYGVDILGPVAAPISFLRNKFRRHLLLKSPTAGALLHVLSDTLPRLPDAARKILTIDVDPQSLL